MHFHTHIYIDAVSHTHILFGSRSVVSHENLTVIKYFGIMEFTVFFGG